MKICFTQDAFADYKAWASEDKKIFEKINSLINDVIRSPFSGLGKPEPLKHELSGFWSRRITSEHRMVYQVRNDSVFIASCKFHY
ncbi:MAG: Txe/YoeB family addiction module toxin [Spirochaetota bacterium]